MFVYTAILEKPTTEVAWFKDANNAAYNSVVNAVRSAPGFVSGSWEQDANDPKKFVIQHTWNSKSEWKVMSNGLKQLAASQMSEVYRVTNGITKTVTLGE